MKKKPDDRRVHTDQVQKNTSHTRANMEAARDMMANTDNGKMQNKFEEKSKLRNTDLKNQRKEIKNESKNSQKGYE